MLGGRRLRSRANLTVPRWVFLVGVRHAAKSSEASPLMKRCPAPPGGVGIHGPYPRTSSSKGISVSACP